MAEKLKINTTILQDFISQYKKVFKKRLHDDEIYKWQAVKCFQDNWNIDALDFPTMLKTALAKTGNLLAAAGKFPRRMIETFADADPEVVRAMFEALFDESRDIATRVAEFESSAKKLLEGYPTWNSTFQDPNSISTYLWLRYPEKYYIYKYTFVKDITPRLCNEKLSIDKLDRMVFGFRLYDAVCEELGRDTELVSLLKESLSDDCYPDDALKTLTMDVCYFIQSIPSEKDDNSNHETGIRIATSQMQNVEKNIILYGPPGTGKTYSTVQYAVAIIKNQTLENVKKEDYEEMLDSYYDYKNDGLIEFTTFHQSFGYEEFIEGIRPVLSNGENVTTGNDIKYEIHGGIFKSFCTKAKANAQQNHVFIIDEINRGNISKIFGELITLIESSRRIGEQEAMWTLLPYSKEPFGVPNNMYIIGTMNTADRSIALIDTALRRRFSFVEMPPDCDVLKGVSVDGIDIARMLELLNRRITVLLDREHTIGHSYLLPLKINPTMKTLTDIFEKKIFPLLQEYFHDDYEKIQLVLGDDQEKDDDARFIIKKSDAGKLFKNPGFDLPDYFEINREAFKNPAAYEFLR